jgi:FkbM family methyltransferase
MVRRFEKSLKRWRDNYYVSQLLTGLSRPLHSFCSGAARQIERKVHKNAVTIKLPNGKRFSIGRNSGVGLASSLFWHGLDGFEPETCKTLRFFFERVGLFVDVGANCGYYAVLSALWNPQLHVIAFEPVPSIFECLKKNVQLNQVSDRIVCENMALSSHSGSAWLYLPQGEGLDIETTGTLTAESWQSKKGSPRMEVKTIRFDEYAAQPSNPIELIKIDVEDFEADVLDGMRETVARDRPFIVCEILSRPHKNARTQELVQALDYQPYWITDAGYVKVSAFDFDRYEYSNFLLSPVTNSAGVLGNLDVLWRLAQQDNRRPLAGIA